MPYVITQPCIDVKDKSCVDVCPVSCIYIDSDDLDRKLYIHPDECIDCGACEPECPWQAIFEEEATPAPFQDDIKLNYAIVENSADFKVAQHEKIPHPNADQVVENKKKWGLTA